MGDPKDSEKEEDAKSIDGESATPQASQSPLMLGLEARMPAKVRTIEDLLRWCQHDTADYRVQRLRRASFSLDQLAEEPEYDFASNEIRELYNLTKERLVEAIEAAEAEIKEKMISSVDPKGADQEKLSKEKEVGDQMPPVIIDDVDATGKVVVGNGRLPPAPPVASANGLFTNNSSGQAVNTSTPTGPIHVANNLNPNALFGGGQSGASSGTQVQGPSTAQGSGSRAIQFSPSATPSYGGSFLSQSALALQELPKDLPSFSGKAIDWPGFKEIFDFFVTPVNLPGAYKKELLVKSMPSSHVSIIKMHPSYDAAMAALSREFESSGRLNHDLHDLVAEIPELRRNATAAMWTKFEASILAIQVRTQNQGNAFESEIFNMLKLKLGEHESSFNRKSKLQSLAGLLTFVAEEISHCHRDEESANRRKAYGSSAPTAAKNTPRSNARVNSIQQDEPCTFCQGQHFRRNCPLPKDKRRAALRAANRCFRCLSPRSQGHECEQCCHLCKAPYNTLICRCTTATKPQGRRYQGGPRRPPPSGAAPAASLPAPQPAASTSERTAPRNAPVTVSTIRVAYAREVKEEECVIHEENSYLPTLKVTASGPEGELPVRLLTDTGATDSFITDSVADKLGLKRRTTKKIVHLWTFANDVPQRITEKVYLTIRSLDDPSVTTVAKMYVVNGVFLGDLPPPSPPLLDLARRHKIVLSDSDNEDPTIDILIGTDVYSDAFLLPMQPSIKPQKGVAFVQTRFGWVLMGRPGGGPRREGSHRVTFVRTSSNSITTECLAPHQNLVRAEPIWSDLERLFLDPLSEESVTNELQENFVTKFGKGIRLDPATKRYVVPLPWKSEDRPHPNYSAAMAQMHALVKRLSLDNKFEAYDAALMEFVRLNYAEPVESYRKDEGYIIPHFPVYRASSATTPIRPVFNASASGKSEKSLNDCIYVGIWRQTSLVDMALRWRMYKLAVMGDIKKAFLQINIEPKDRPYLRFLWTVDGKVQMFQMKSLLFGAAASPFILFAVLRHLFEHQAPDLLHVTDNQYMDDSGLFANSMNELRELVERVTKVLAMASFELHKWTALPEVATALGFEVKHGDAAWLGTKWDLEGDLIKFDPPVCPDGPLTRRILASLFALPYDVLGLLGPYHTRTRLFYREIIKCNQSWDARLTEEQEVEARTILGDLQFLKEITFPRVVSESAEFEIWMFGDASCQAYGICAYVHDMQSKESRLLLSRSHLAAKNKTTPQLELVAAMLVADTIEHIKRCLPREPSCWRLFTDSMVTLHRLRSDNMKQEPFVRTRVDRILAHSSIDQWYHIPTKQNPADIVSRGLSLRLMRQSELWLHGPNVEVINNTIPDTQMRLQCYSMTTTASPMVGAEFDFKERVNACKDYRTLYKIISCLMTFMNNRHNLVQRWSRAHNEQLTLPALIDIAVWRTIQSVALELELPFVQKGVTVVGATPLAKLPLYLDEYGIIRIRKRIGEATLPHAARFPIVLKDHSIVRSFVAHVHSNHVHHAARDATTRYLNHPFYLPNMSRIVRSVVGDCMHCRRYRTGEPFSAPMAPLPADRCTPGHAFEVTGIDLFGPIHNGMNRVTKYYGMIFACAKSRAIHLELVESKDTESVMRAYMRFASLYGHPHKVRCDNEKSFHKLNKTQQIIHERFIKAQPLLAAKYHCTEWIYNVPLAPWYGGWYERLIQVVKRSMDRIRLNTADTYERLLTVLREAQHMVNSRPLLHHADQPALTPAHLVYGHAIDHLEPIALPLNTRDDTLLEYSRIQRDLDQLWRIWNEQYLTSLRVHYWPKTRGPVINEMVVIQDKRSSRYEWELGLIVKMIPSPRDGYFRYAEVKSLANGEIRRRAVHLLVPIERSVQSEDSTSPVAGDPTVATTPASTGGAPVHVSNISVHCSLSGTLSSTVRGDEENSSTSVGTHASNSSPQLLQLLPETRTDADMNRQLAEAQAEILLDLCDRLLDNIWDPTEWVEESRSTIAQMSKLILNLNGINLDQQTQARLIESKNLLEHALARHLIRTPPPPDVGNQRIPPMQANNGQREQGRGGRGGRGGRNGQGGRGERIPQGGRQEPLDGGRGGGRIRRRRRRRPRHQERLNRVAPRDPVAQVDGEIELPEDFNMDEEGAFDAINNLFLNPPPPLLPGDENLVIHVWSPND